MTRSAPDEGTPPGTPRDLGDGGLAYGQLAVAAARPAAERSPDA